MSQFVNVLFILPDVRSDMLVVVVKVDKANVLHDDAHYEHPYEGRQRGDLDHDPAPEVGYDREHCQHKELATGSCRLPQHHPYRHPHQYTCRIENA